MLEHALSPLPFSTVCKIVVYLFIPKIPYTYSYFNFLFRNATFLPYFIWHNAIKGTRRWKPHTNPLSRKIYQIETFSDIKMLIFTIRTPFMLKLTNWSSYKSSYCIFTDTILFIYYRSLFCRIGSHSPTSFGSASGFQNIERINLQWIYRDIDREWELFDFQFY